MLKLSVSQALLSLNRGFLIGMLLGWHYPTEKLIYSLCLPPGQDAEFTGFFVYCTLILQWLPPLIFSGLIQNGISQSYGVLAVAMFGLVAVILISLLPPWDQMRGEFELPSQAEQPKLLTAVKPNVDAKKSPVAVPTKEEQVPKKSAIEVTA